MTSPHSAGAPTVLHVNVTDLKSGAGRATYRLHQGLCSMGVASEMLVQAKLSHDDTVHGPHTALGRAFSIARTLPDSLPLKIYPQRRAPLFSLQWIPDTLAGRVRRFAPHLVNLHWVCRGLMQISTLGKLPGPIVWTMHDMWPFTGGCHISFGCDRYQDACGACPELTSTRDRDLSRWVWQRKLKHWQELDLTLVAPSTWMASCARKSSLFSNKRIETIPHGLDLTRFRPNDQRDARRLLELPADRQLLLFVSAAGTGKRHKGFHLLVDALQQLQDAGLAERLELVVAGPTAGDSSNLHGIQVHYLARINDDTKLALLYAASDATIIPSLQESFGQVAMESLACGTPAIGFSATGLQDVINHKVDGYLAEPFSVEDLARGIEWILEDSDRRGALTQAARLRAEKEYDYQLQAERYAALYEDLSASAQRSHGGGMRQ